MTLPPWVQVFLSLENTDMRLFQWKIMDLFLVKKVEFCFGDKRKWGLIKEGLMHRIFQRNVTAITFLICALSSITNLSAKSLPQIEGFVKSASYVHGYYDLILRVSKKGDGESGPAKGFMEIYIPKVEIKSGKFSLFLDAGLEAYAENELTFQVDSRPFKTSKPFQPGKISKFSIEAEGTPTKAYAVLPNPKGSITP
jgi:hypothetical protein